MAIQKKETAADFSKIKCPYCFKEFSHESVHFKAMTVKDSSSWMDDFDDDDSPFDFFGENAGANRANAHEVEELFQEREDRLYKKFWSKYANEMEWDYAKYPVITGKDARMMRGEYRKDADGFVYAVEDAYGMETRERICPNCHNPLPPNYGKYPVYFLATVGITSSGKTVYLSQLMKQMDVIMSNIGLGSLDMSESNQKFIREHPVKKGVKLPKGTPPGVLTIPLFYILLAEKGYSTLVFYDVAGENCVTAAQMSKFSPFIKNADAILMILDPEQFQKVSRNADNEIANPKAVMTAMFNSFVGSENQGGQAKIPFAIALSKSDKLVGNALISSNSNLFRPLEFDRRNTGFDMQQYKNVSAEVRKFLNDSGEGEQVLATAKKCFPVNGLFAFSAVNCEIEEKMETDEEGNENKVSIPLADPDPIRIEEPLLWMLYEFGIIGAKAGGKGRKDEEEEGSMGFFSRFFGRRK